MVYLILIVAVLIGAGIVLYTKPSKNFVQFLLSFSGAYLLSVTILHLLPEVYENSNAKTGVYILIGIFIQSILEYFSKGAEHGHVHIHEKITKIPWLLFIGLGIHAFFEGIPLASKELQPLVWAIFIHKIPVAIILTTFLIQTKLSKYVIIGLLASFAIISPLGYAVFDKIPFLTNYTTEITAIIIGIFIHISSIILFETNENHNFSLKKFIAIILGFVIAFLSL